MIIKACVRHRYLPADAKCLPAEACAATAPCHSPGLSAATTHSFRPAWPIAFGIFSHGLIAQLVEMFEIFQCLRI